MIDREARRQLISALKKYAVGKIDNVEYQDLIDGLMRSPDGSVAEIASATDMIFDSLYTPVRLTGKNRLDKVGRREIARWILFLNGNYETRKSHWSPWVRKAISIMGCLMQIGITILTCGLNLLFMLLFEKVFEDKLWPFKSTDDLQSALRRSYLGKNGS